MRYRGFKISKMVAGYFKADRPALGQRGGVSFTLSSLDAVKAKIDEIVDRDGGK